MGVMAVETLFVHFKRLMRHGGLLDILSLVHMTGQAEIALCRPPQVVPVVAAVRAVAVDAGIAHRGVNKLRGFEIVAFIRVTGETHIVTLRHEELRVIALVRVNGRCCNFPRQPDRARISLR